MTKKNILEELKDMGLTGDSATRTPSKPEKVQEDNEGDLLRVLNEATENLQDALAEFRAAIQAAVREDDEETPEEDE